MSSVERSIETRCRQPIDDTRNDSQIVTSHASLLTRFRRDDAGSTAAMVVVFLMVMLGFLSLTADAGLLFVHRTQMQKAVDAAALAGARDIGLNGNSAADAANYATLNGVSTNTTTTFLSGSDTVYSSGDAWTATATRTVALAFAPLLGLPQATVSVRAEAIDSPLSSIPASDVLPYAIWGGNTPGCCGSPPPAIPPSYKVYDWSTMDQPSANGVQVTYRDNQWPSAVIYPDPNNCGGINQPVCNINWQVGPEVSFKGFFNQMGGTLTVDSWSALYSQSGNSSEPYGQICQILTMKPPVAVMPVIDAAQERSGTVFFHIKYLLGISLQPVSGCSGGHAMGTSFYGNVVFHWTISHGKGNGTDYGPGPVHVLQLWQ